ncbi:hexokinase-2, chloroplastic-like isoform X2 [Glycine soja]|uniref:hexokinase-2, chloroplastic-like isoform X2 n=1 Tax=Glycine soja TaxID=3848 RepID=UPI001040DEE9|nr:hexokinase-2, chloroplastic-like isoform X2 [Glycine soja]
MVILEVYTFGNECNFFYQRGAGVEVNDTMATLARAEYWDNDVVVAVILGTGSNACYVEHINAIPKLQGYVSSSRKMIISIEWGAFSNGLPLTKFDREMDATSINPGEQAQPKRILEVKNILGLTKQHVASHLQWHTWLLQSLQKIC